MTEYLWIMIGGLFGLFIASVTREYGKLTLFTSVIIGVGLLFLVSYFLQNLSPKVFQGLMIFSAMICCAVLTKNIMNQNKFRNI